MFEDTFETELTLQAKGDDLDQFLKTLEDDLVELRSEIAKFKYKRPKKGRSKRSPMSTVFDFAKLHDEIDGVESVIVAHSETNRMLHTRLRAEVGKPVKQIKDWLAGLKKIGAGVLPEELSVEISERLAPAVRERLAEARDTANQEHTVPHDLESDLLTLEKKRALGQLFDGIIVADLPAAERLKTAGGLDDTQAENVLKFYVYYAVFIEYFNSIKLLYQILLKEYEELDLIDDDVVTGLRTVAIFKITAFLCDHKWRGPGNAPRREQFRTGMLKAIRSKLMERAVAEKEGDGNIAPMSALCLSGGGIRSATFSLGVIQGLARHGLLDKFDYLSTVSGGGYIGSWLTAWVHRARNGIQTVQNRLIEKSAGEVEPPQVTYLRSYSNYMSPRVGLFSADTWTLVGVYLRNLLLNWTVFVPLIAAFLLLPRLLAEVIVNGQVLVGPSPSWRAGLFVAVSALLGCFGLFWTSVFRPSLAKFFKNDSVFSQHFSRDDIGAIKNAEFRIVRLCVLPTVLFALGLTIYWNWVGPHGERLVPVRQAIDYINDNATRWIVFVIFVIIFGIAATVNLLYRRKQRSEGNWDKIFGSVIFFLCIVISWFQLYSTSKNVKLFGLVLFTEVIFVVGFFTARVVVWLSRKNSAAASLWENVAIEFGMSFLASSLGGMLLYVVDENLGGFYRVLQADPGRPSAEIYATFAVPLFLSVFLLAATLFVGIGSKIMDDMDREWMSRLGAWILITIVGWLAVFGLVLLGPIFLEMLETRARAGIVSLGGVAGAITLLFGYYAKSSPQAGLTPPGKSRMLARLAPQIAAPVFAAFLMILIVLGTTALIGFAGGNIDFLRYNTATTDGSGHGIWVILIWILFLAGVGCLMGWWVNVNKFSLHATYRERLIRAYLGASRATTRIETANSFTGLDENDNVEMWKLFQRPFHVVNMTLNIAKTASLRWQTRKAESFTATPFHCGSANMGDGSGNYRSSKYYGANKAGNAITLGTAAAISGAAASPNMGYYTQSAPVSALMALFNVRLGWWLGNPGRRGSKTFQKNAPEFAPRLLYDEALGRTEDTNPYIYLSDGGHFDNLGLYEMVLRRCRFILLCDAAADGEFEFSDLGSAIHKIRVDMGIPIEFESGDVPIKGRNCSIGRIKYSAIDRNGIENDGLLIYIKPTLDGKVPMDVVNYEKKYPKFPHESTADQMYSEPQFESYRSLGFHMIDSICGPEHHPSPGSAPSLRDLGENVFAYLKNFKNNAKPVADNEIEIIS